MKKAAALTILLVFLLSSVTAYAAEPRAITARPSLSFNGTTALCEVTVSSYGKSIDLMIYQRFLALCLALSTAGLLIGFELPVPDEWAKRDTGCEIIISEPNVDSGFIIPWDRRDEEITVIPIPDASASSDNSLVN